MFLFPILDMSFGLDESSAELLLSCSYLLAFSVGDGEGVDDSDSLRCTSRRLSDPGIFNLSVTVVLVLRQGELELLAKESPSEVVEEPGLVPFGENLALYAFLGLYEVDRFPVNFSNS